MKRKFLVLAGAVAVTLAFADPPANFSGWENEGSGTDDFGFTALPAGMKFTTSTQDGFTYHGCSSLMWAATEADGGAADSLAYHMYLDCSNDNAIVNTVKKINGLSVRCVKDE